MWHKWQVGEMLANIPELPNRAKPHPACLPENPFQKKIYKVSVLIPAFSAYKLK